MVLCTGCNREFSATGYMMHAACTRTSLCHAAHNSRLAFLLNHNDDIDIDVDATGSRIFEGDVFGEYTEDDFDWPKDEESENNSDGTETDDDDDDNDDNDSASDNADNDDPGIELALTTHTLRPPFSTNTPSDQACDTSGAPPPSVAQSAHPCAPSQSTQPAWPQTPQPSDYVIEPFPGDTAGKPLEASAAQQSDFAKYQQRLNSDTIYAPFISQIDWEIARWIKMRGPSSSAANELLEIDGVIYSLRCFSE